MRPRREISPRCISRAISRGLGASSASICAGTKLTLSSSGSLEYHPSSRASFEWAAADERAGVYAIELDAGSVATRDPQGNAFELTLGVGHSVDLVLKDDLVTDAADEAQVGRRTLA